MVMGRFGPRGAGLVACCNRGDLALLTRRELCVPLALAGHPGWSGCGLCGSQGQRGRTPDVLARNLAAFLDSSDDLARIIPWIEPADGCAAGDSGAVFRRCAFTHGQTGT